MIDETVENVAAEQGDAREEIAGLFESFTAQTKARLWERTQKRIPELGIDPELTAVAFEERFEDSCDGLIPNT